MRSDALGLFWEDLPPEKKTKVKLKCVPPEPVWLAPDYLPGLEEALAFNVPLLSDSELISLAGEELTFDLEIYHNYFLAAFKHAKTNKALCFEMFDGQRLDLEKLEWVTRNFVIYGFNSYGFDLPILALALAGRPTSILKQATDALIYNNWRPRDLLREYKCKALTVNHFDLIEVAPLQGSLKIYSGRLHCRKMQDLPFHPAAILSRDQMAITKIYCVNDLDNTILLRRELAEQISLRERLGVDYNVDVRSKSDAQIAEVIISKEVEALNGGRVKRPTIDPGTVFYYQVPKFLKFESALLNWALWLVASTPLIVGEDGSIMEPPEFEQLNLQINSSKYTMRIGGLHSTEKNTSHVSDEEYILLDRDVISYYPWIILILCLFPKHLGMNFLKVYRSLVDRRVLAKERGDKVTADSLKITVNGSFGKLGSKYSNMYAPDLCVQVTITGQLTILMLVERLELAGFTVVSANTDGIVTKCKRTRQDEFNAIVSQWEKDTGFSTEEAVYKALYSRDINNYIAVKEDGTTKNKGAYSNPWSKPKEAIFRFHKNPTNLICIDAIEKLLTTGAQLEQTIRSCTDITKFITVRTVKGGAVKDGQYLGKAIRWYYAEGETGCIIYALSGKKVARTDGAQPLMEMPNSLPSNIDYQWYIEEAKSMLNEIAYTSSTIDKF